MGTTHRRRTNGRAVKRWFAVSRFGLQAAPPSGDAAESELFWIHAKELGTMLTACGLGALSWQKHWEPFQSVGLEQSCPACVVVVSDYRARSRSGASRADVGVRVINDHRFVDF